jgi:hypothetical protein
MEALGIFVWLAWSAVAAALLVVLARPPGEAIYRCLAYAVAGALLGSFVGSEGFKEEWLGFSSDIGPDVDGFQIVMGTIGALVVGDLALLASFATPAPVDDVP